MGAQIVWTKESERDLNTIFSYIAKDSPSRARQFIGRLLGEIEGVGRFPRSYRVVPEFRRQDLRELIFPPFRVVFRIRE